MRDISEFIKKAENPEDDSDRLLQEVMRFIFDILHGENPTLIDVLFDKETNDTQKNQIFQIYEQIDVSKCSNVIMVALIRTPFLQFHKFQEWKDFVNKVAIELEKRGKNPAKTLVGCYPVK